MTDLDLSELAEVTNIANVEDALAALDEEIIAQPEAVEDQLLDIEELEMLDETPEEASVEAAPAGEENLDFVDDDLLAELEIASAKQSVYESQAAETMPDLAETADGTTAAAIKTKKARTTSKAAGTSTPRTPRDLAAVPAEFFLLSNDLPDMEDDDLTAQKTAVISTRPAQVKIAEKFDNLFLQVAAGKKPSVYVMLALDLLNAKGSFTSTELVTHYKANGLGEGTARSQTGQIMVLFDVAGIGKRSGQTMTKRANSMLIDRINALSATPAPTPAA